jgi:hypothetical protein
MNRSLLLGASLILMTTLSHAQAGETSQGDWDWEIR